jgi:hypothetical protein
VRARRVLQREQRRRAAARAEHGQAVGPAVVDDRLDLGVGQRGERGRPAGEDRLARGAHAVVDGDERVL